jgi:hypothetical protein
MPEIVVVPGLSAHHRHGADFLDGDLLILTQLEGYELGPGPLLLDQALGGVVSAALKEQGFRGVAGETCVITLPGLAEQTEQTARPRYVAVVGLGTAVGIASRRVCALFNAALELACRLQARSLILPVFPYRVSSDNLSLKATGAVLRCLVQVKAARGEVGLLKEFRLLCAPQAKANLLSGLAVERTLCHFCRIPHLNDTAKP